MSYKEILKRVHAGLSTEDSVSYIVDGYVVSSIKDKNGENYNCVFRYPGHSYEKESIDKLMNVFSLLLICIVSILGQSIIKSLFGSMSFILALEIVIFLFISTMFEKALNYMLSKDPKILKNHGAEHKVFNAATKKGSVPTLEEAKKASRFCPWCGVKVFSVILSLISLNIVLSAFNLYVIPFGIVLVAGYKLPGYDPFCYYVQKRKTTAEPSDEELSLALNAFTAAYEISNGRQPRKEETPTNEIVFNYLFNLNARLGPGEKLSYEEVKQLEAFRDRLEIENEILDVVFGTIVR